MGSQPLPVLIADDDEEVREALGLLLDAKGFRVTLAVDGQQALDHLTRGFTPCAILLDWMMPRVDGEAFLRTRAASSSLSSIPVFVISATHAPANDIRIQGFLAKPFNADDLLPLLRKVCDKYCPASRRAHCPSFMETDNRA